MARSKYINQYNIHSAPIKYFLKYLELDLPKVVGAGSSYRPNYFGI